MNYHPKHIINQFPALGRGTIFLDNPGGTQVTQSVIDAMRDYLILSNANHGGAFLKSRMTDAVVTEARLAFADFLGASSPSEIVFGPNMTTLTFSMARALGRMLEPGDEILVTYLDHDANIAPWRTLEEKGIVLRWVDIHPDDCTLDMASFERELSERTRLVAVTLASNAVGSVPDVRAITEMAHSVGAMVFVDAVHYAPHFTIDVRELDCDFLVCSVYKFYGPHLGVLYGKYELLEQLAAYKVRPSRNIPPEKFETGALSFEGVAGARAAVDYLAALGEKYGTGDKKVAGGNGNRRENIKRGLEVVQVYERDLARYLISGLGALPNMRVYGVTDFSSVQERAPTVAFNITNHAPRQVTEYLAKANINAWDGNYYALALMERLALQETGGAVRVGLAHYNTVEELDFLLEVLGKLAS